MCSIVDSKLAEIYLSNSFEVLAPPESDAITKFFEKPQDLYLCQSVENCTRFRGGHSPSTLDYIFTKEENMIDSLCYDAPQDASSIIIQYTYADLFHLRSCGSSIAF